MRIAQFILDSYAVSLDDKHGRQGGCEWKSIRQGERNTSRSKFVSGGQLQLARKVSAMFKIVYLCPLKQLDIVQHCFDSLAIKYSRMPMSIFHD